MTAIHDLRIPRHYPHPRFSGSARHALADSLEVFHGESLFQDERATEVSGNRPCGSNIIDRPAYRKMADIPSGEEAGTDYEAIGREGYALPWSGSGKIGGIVSLPQLIASIRLEEDPVDDPLHHRPAASVSQQYGFVHCLPYHFRYRQTSCE